MDQKGVILLTGISEPYFNKHFKLLKVIDKPSDRRVVWQFSVNGYQAVLNDAIGYSADRFARRVYTHSIALGETTEIQRPRFCKRSRLPERSARSTLRVHIRATTFLGVRLMFPKRWCRRLRLHKISKARSMKLLVVVHQAHLRSRLTRWGLSGLIR